MTKNFTFLFFIFISASLSAQQLQWLKLNKYKTAVLSDTLSENSGLAFFNNRMFTINDSGNTPDLFEIDQTTGEIKKIFSTPLRNKDWEAVTADSTNIYIGDFGNNLGNRDDLVVYRLPKIDSLEVGNIESLPFYYPEQKNFNEKNLQNNFDAEAIIYLNGKIHVFTKEWVSRATTHYTIDPSAEGKQPAEKLEFYQTGYVVTDAAYFEGRLFLVGYTKKGEVYLTVFRESSPEIFFEREPQKYYLGSSLSVGQIEGIAADKNGLYISGEALRLPFLKVKPRLYFIPYADLK